MERYGTETWSLELPEGWTFEHDGEFATLAGEPADGALQIGVAFKDTEVLEGDLFDFAAEQLEAGAEAESCEAGDFRGIRFRIEDESSACRLWYVRNGLQLLFISHICPVATKGEQDERVDAVLASLEVETDEAEDDESTADESE